MQSILTNRRRTPGRNLRRCWMTPWPNWRNDRTALVLRFFEDKTAAKCRALRMEEASAQKRVARALEKLRAIFMNAA